MARFDLAALFDAIDRERTRRGLSWSALSREVEVAASTIRRYAEADDAEADGVLTLISWTGVAPEVFVTDGSVEGSPLAEFFDGVVRVDMDLVRATPGGEAIGPSRTRTTIQHLVEIANSGGRPVASITRRR